MIITIDGPTASGKSTIAAKVAEHLGYFCLSSGIFYRALAYVLYKQFNYSLNDLQHNLDINDINNALDPSMFIAQFKDKQCITILFDQADITGFLKTSEIAQAASIISTHRTVRLALNNIIHTLARNKNIVVEGRDMGSIVFPDAAYKFFITASIEVRAQRWQAVQRKNSNMISLEEAKREVVERDERDRNRSIAPLIIPEGAIIIDTSDLSIQGTVKALLAVLDS